MQIRTFTNAVAMAALLFSVTVAHQALAAAKASDIDPTRYKIGNVVYPPGHKPSKEELADIDARSGKKSTAVTIAPKGKPKHPARHKDASDD